MANNTDLDTLSQVSEADIAAALDLWWDGEKVDSALPGDKEDVPDIMKPGIEIDSHRAVRALISLEDVVKIEIPETVIKDGGYESFDEMKADLTEKVMVLLETKRKKENA